MCRNGIISFPVYMAGGLRWFSRTIEGVSDSPDKLPMFRNGASVPRGAGDGKFDLAKGFPRSSSELGAPVCSLIVGWYAAEFVGW